MYNTLLFVHILFAIGWVGTGFALQRSFRSILAGEGQVEADRALERSEWAVKWVFIPAPLLVVATGVTMVILNDGIGFSDLWISIALGLFLISMIMNGVAGQRLDKQMKLARAEGSQASPEYARLLQSSLRLGSWDMLLLVGIVAMMVFRPTLA